MGKTTIEWADHSVNPFRARNIETGKVGHFCVKLSAGCKNCYSARMQNPFLTQLDFVAENRSKVELFFENSAIDEVLRRKKPTRYFWADMTDLFLEDYPDTWLYRCFAAMVLTPQHTHLVLTKRIERAYTLLAGARGRDTRRNVQDILEDHGHRALAYGLLDNWPLRNLWLGTSVEDRKQIHRTETLRKTPAALRFLSVEPLLEDLGHLDLTDISWCIVGGESGPGARPFDISWARSIVQQCKDACVACFYKQGGRSNACEEVAHA